jgi:hypothetical protein
VRELTQRGQIPAQALIEVARDVFVGPVSRYVHPRGIHDNCSRF